MFLAQVHIWAGHVGLAVDKVALQQVFSEYFSFPCQSSFHQFLHHYNHPGLAQQTYWQSQCSVDPIGLHTPLFELKKKKRTRKLVLKTPS
jgi:hypothetical protein